MSTPISRNNKRQGLDLYAPRRARDRLSGDDQAASLTSEEEYETELEPERAGGLGDRDEAAVLDWVEQAIRDVVDLDHGAQDPEGPDPSLVGPEPEAEPEAAMEDDGRRWAPRSFDRRPEDEAIGRAPPRRSRLDPEIVPEPHPDLHSNGLFPPLARLSLAIALAGAVAFGLTALLSPSNDSWFKSVGQRVAGVVDSGQSPALSTPPSRLIVEDQQAFANQPLSLAVDVAGRQLNESLLLDGLAQGTTLSAGKSTSPSSWRLSTDKLRGLYLYAPKDFVGVMNTTVDLLAPDRRLLDSRSMRLKWVATQPKPAPAPSVALARVEASAGNPVAPAKADLPAIDPIDSSDAAMLMQRGRESLNNGDVSGARVAFGRLADAGIAEAALALADTYDPDYLAAHNFVGVQGDRAMARELYQRAKELGSAEAGRILAQMSGN